MVAPKHKIRKGQEALDSKSNASCPRLCHLRCFRPFYSLTSLDLRGCARQTHLDLIGEDLLVDFDQVEQHLTKFQNL